MDGGRAEPELALLNVPRVTFKACGLAESTRPSARGSDSASVEFAAAPTSLSPAARAAGTFRRSSAPWGSLRSSALQTGGLHAVTYRYSAPDNSIAGCSASK